MRERKIPLLSRTRRGAGLGYACCQRCTHFCSLCLLLPPCPRNWLQRGRRASPELQRLVHGATQFLEHFHSDAHDELRLITS